MNKEFPPFTQILQVKILRIFMIKGRAIRKLVWEGGGGAVKGGEEQKKNAQGKIKLKKKQKQKKNIHTGTPGNAKKYSCKGLKKKIIQGEFHAARKFPPPPPPPNLF